MKITAFLFALLFLSMGFTQAQNPENKFGLKFGLNLTDVNYVIKTPESNIGFSSKTGFHAGFFGQYLFHPKWSMNAELLYSQKGGQDPLEQFMVVNLDEYVLQLHYLTLSLLPNYHFGPIAFELGPEFGYKIKEELSGELIENPEIGESVWDKDFDFSIAGGVKYNFRRLNIGLRYVYGFTYLSEFNITDIDGNTIGTEKIGRNTSFQVSIGYAINKIPKS